MLLKDKVKAIKEKIDYFLEAETATELKTRFWEIQMCWDDLWEEIKDFEDIPKESEGVKC